MRIAGYDIPDPWEEPIGDFLKRKAQTPYVTFQEIYELLDIPAVRQVPDNAKRIKEIATKCGWVYTRRRIGGSRDRKWAFFPDHVGQQADE